MSGELFLDERQLHAAGFELVDVGGGHPGYWSFRFGDDYELTLEPLLFNAWTLAVYRRGELVMPAKLELPPRPRRVTETGSS